MQSKLKVLIVEDSNVYRRILKEAVEMTGVATVTDSAENGIIALDKIQESNTFDLALMDINMPGMDGIETLKKIKILYPKIVVIMISSTGSKNCETTLQTLQYGAMDFIVKPLSENFETNMKILSEQLKELFIQIKSGINQINKNPIPKKDFYEDKIQKKSLENVDVVLIASSTGGPVALEKIFERLDKSFSKPILIVQHMPPVFTKVFANNLDKKSHMSVIEGIDNCIVREGQAIVAPGGFHMIVRKDSSGIITTALDDGPLIQGLKPAADILFKSVAEVYEKKNILIIILTGMGSDGRNGLAILKSKCKCYCIAQNEATSVVYGMARCAVEAGLCDEVLAIDDIPKRIQEIVKGV